MAVERGFSDSYGDDSSNSNGASAAEAQQQQFRRDYDRFDYSKYKHPLPILGPLFGFDESRARTLVASWWGKARNGLQRDLKSDEEDALASAICTQLRSMSYAGPVGAMAGLYRAYDTRATWRLPFWKMGKDFDPAIVKLPKGPTILKGEAAKLWWRVLRNGLYAANGTVFGTTLLLMFAASSVEQKIMRDPRLRDLRAVLLKRIQDTQRQRIEARHPTPQGDEAPGPIRKSAGELWGNHRRSIGSGQDKVDDSSPSSGQGMDDAYTDTSVLGRSSNGAQESYGEDWGQSNQSQSRPDTSQSTPSAPSTQKRMSALEVADDFDGFDDASPVASSGGGQRGPPSQSGSAWERLRRRAADGTDTKEPGSRGAGSSTRENYSFSNVEENRQLAKSEAQREFDARVERERHGGDFSEGKGTRRGW